MIDQNEVSDTPLYIAILSISVIMAVTIHVVPRLPLIKAWFAGWVL